MLGMLNRSTSNMQMSMPLAGRDLLRYDFDRAYRD